MRKTILLLLFIVITSSSCRERQRKGAFQGVWYKPGYNTEAFVVRGDSIYYPGRADGYYYDLNKDTLIIQFSNRETRSLILSFSSQRLNIWDMSLSQDTITLQRRPSSEADTLLN